MCASEQVVDKLWLNCVKRLETLQGKVFKGWKKYDSNRDHFSNIDYGLC